MKKLKALLEKSVVKAHTRTLKNGRPVQVREYSDKRTKKSSFALAHGDLNLPKIIPPPSWKPAGSIYVKTDIDNSSNHTANRGFEKDGKYYKPEIGYGPPKHAEIDGKTEWTRNRHKTKEFSVLKAVEDLPATPKDVRQVEVSGEPYIEMPLYYVLDMSDDQEIHDVFDAQEKLDYMEDTIRELDRRHIEYGDSLQFAQDSDTQMPVLVDFSNASFDSQFKGENTERWEMFLSKHFPVIAERRKQAFRNVVKSEGVSGIAGKYIYGGFNRPYYHGFDTAMEDYGVKRGAYEVVETDGRDEVTPHMYITSTTPLPEEATEGQELTLLKMPSIASPNDKGRYGNSLEKSLVRSHTRTLKSGKKVFVRAHHNKVPTPVGYLKTEGFNERAAKQKPLTKAKMFPKPSLQEYKRETPNDPLRFLVASIIWALTPDSAGEATQQHSRVENGSAPSSRLAKQAIAANQYAMNANYHVLVMKMKKLAKGHDSQTLLDKMGNEVFLRDKAREERWKKAMRNTPFSQYRQEENDKISGFMLEKFVAGYIKVNGLSYPYLQRYAEKAGQETPDMIRRQWKYASLHFQGNPEIKEVRMDAMNKPDGTGFMVLRKPVERELRNEYRWMGAKEVQNLIAQKKAEYEEARKQRDAVANSFKSQEEFEAALRDFNRRNADYMKRQKLMSKPHGGFDVKPATQRKKRITAGKTQ